MRRSSIILLGLALAVLDQISKYLAKLYLPITTNTGAAFGMFKGYNFIFVVISAVVVVFVIEYVKKHPYPELGLILGGILGNMADRVLLGHVVDFINLGWWPSFNLADSLSTIGVIFLVVRLMKN